MVKLWPDEMMKCFKCWGCSENDWEGRTWYFPKSCLLKMPSPLSALGFQSDCPSSSLRDFINYDTVETLFGQNWFRKFQIHIRVSIDTRFV